jgi:hypothetical protein
VGRPVCTIRDCLRTPTNFHVVNFIDKAGQPQEDMFGYCHYHEGQVGRYYKKEVAEG